MQDTTSAQTISTRFWLIFWGLLLVIGDINIMGIDILPDFVGYILVALGCAGLSSASRRLATASALSWVLVPLAVIAFVLDGTIATALDYVSLALHLVMVWSLLGGVMEMAAARQRMDLSQRASRYRVAYTVLMCLTTLAGIIGDPLAVIGIVAVICILTLLVFILHLIYRAVHELAASPAL